jgi:hypothetical protein
MFISNGNINANLILNQPTIADIAVTSGTASLTTENGIYNAPFPSTIRIIKSSHSSTDYGFNFGKKLEFSPTLSGRYILQFSVYNLSGETLSFDLILYTNGSPTTYNFSIREAGIWQSFFKDFNFSDGLKYDFSFVIKQGTSSTATLLMGGFMLQNAYNDIFDFDYKKGGNPTMWVQRFDGTNTPTLTASTNNIQQVQINTEGNGYASEHLNLLNANGKVTPINVGDVLNVNFSYTIQTPSGTDRFIETIALVNSVLYSAETHILLKGSGNDDFVTVSWSIPVTQTIKTNGIEIALKPNANCVVKNRRITVTRTHEAL